MFNIDGVLGRLNSMMGNRFGVNVQFIPISDHSTEAKVAVETVRRNAGAPLIITGKTMFVPVRVDGSLVGTTVVDDITTLQPRDLGQIKDSIDLVLGQGLNAQSFLDRQEIELNQLELVDMPKNVLSFGKFVTRNKRMRELLEKAENLSETQSPITIQAEEGTPFEDIARELGDSDLPFVRSDDHREALKSVDALQQLGSVTFFIPSLHALTPDEQNTLADWFDVAAVQKSPRVVAGTHVELGALVKQEKLNQRLAFRMNAVLKITPLRERPEDIMALIDRLAQHYSENKKSIRNFTPDTINRLMDYSWPGNEIELETEISRLMTSRDRRMILPDALSARIIGSSAKHLFRLMKEQTNLNTAMESLERKLISDGLKRNNGNKSKASRELGISRSGLIQKIEQYGIHEPEI